jgi:AP-2 complex subunit beta-1
LYLVHYARIKPDIALKALPHLAQDMEDANPLVRALALRTMAYIHVREYVEASVAPTKHLLRDSDPYVRKTACFCVAKLYDHDKALVENSDLIAGLNNMLRDENPTVVSSALASLTDIWERSESIKLTIDYNSASKIASILAETSEYVLVHLALPLLLLTPRQMEPNVYSRSPHELCPSGFWSGFNVG